MEFYRALGGRAVARSSERFGAKTLDKVAYAWQALNVTTLLVTGKPFCAQAARSVFSSTHAMVIGPTPPGTGVIAPATCMASA